MAKSDISSAFAQIWPDFPITQQQLEHVTSDFVISCYRKFRETVEQVNERIYDGKSFDSIPKNKDDSVFSLLRYINKFMKKIYPCYTDYKNISLTLTDLYDPTSKRTIVRLKILIQFLIFYETHIETFKSNFAKKLEIQKEVQVKKTAIDNIKEVIGKEAEELVNLKELHTKLQNDKEKIKLRYDNLQHIKDDIDRSNKKLRFDLKALVDTYNTKQTLIANVKANIQSLNEQIVTEDGYKSKLELKKNIIERFAELDNKSEFCSQNLQSRKPNLEEFAVADEKYGKLLEIAEECKLLLTATNEVNNLLQSLKLNYKEKSYELEKCNEDNLKFSNSTQTKKETMHSEALKHKTMQENIKLEVQGIEKEIESEKVELSSDRKLYKSKISNCEKFNNNMEASVQRLSIVYEDVYKNILNSESTATTNLHNSFNELSDFLSNFNKL